MLKIAFFDPTPYLENSPVKYLSKFVKELLLALAFVDFFLFFDFSCRVAKVACTTEVDSETEEEKGEG